jgi:PAS domain S-box-containing protein
VKEKPGVSEDPRVGKILDFILKLVSGDLKSRETLSGQGDDLDGIVIGLNVLAEEISSRVVSLTEAEQRLDEIMEVIIAIASLDYSKRLPISDKSNTFDAIALGLNILGEELQASTVSKDYLDNIIQSMTDMLIVVNQDTKIQTVNQAALDLLGYTESELVGQPLDLVFAPGAFNERGIADLMKIGFFKAVETTYVTRDGCIIPVSFSGSVMHDKNGQVQGIVCVAQDLTERKMLEEEKRMRQEKLAMLGQLAGGVGHELRNPLGAIKNSTYFLNMVLKEPEPEVKETLKILEKEVATSERIISSLLDFARARPPLKRSVNIYTVIREILSLTNISEAIKVKNQVDKSIPTIMADPDQLRQVFGNIILNAIQAMPGGGQLIIKTKASRSDGIAISIIDTGVGIPEENLEKIFEPLFTNKAKGIGLGMAITKTFVEGHGGSIEVRSKTGKGSTFTIKLPFSNNEEK